MIRASIPAGAFAIALAGLPALGSGVLAQEVSPAASPAAMEVVDVVLRDVDGRDVGVATFTATPDGAASIGVEVEGLTTGEHGIHVHEAGICDPAGEKPFTSAGGHYNPIGAAHGGPSRAVGSVPIGTPEDAATPGGSQGHAGDLGNILADDNGTGRLQITVDRFTLAELADADGSALVIHEGPDDLMTDPAGNSGGRIVCGVIFPPQGGATPSAATPTA